MPTGNCRFPEHHSPSAGPPLGLLGAIALGAVVIAFWHTVVVALVVVAILAAIAGAVFLLIHNHGSGYDPVLERQSEAEQAARQIQAAQLAQQLAAQHRPAIDPAPVVHNHLHLHGVSDDEMADAARKALTSPDHQRRAAGLPW
jgi:hypothetical protein